MVVHHVEYHLDAGLMQRLDHGLEFRHLAVRRGRRPVAVVRREEPDRVVAPVVGKAALHQERLGHSLVYRHKLDGCDAEPPQVLDDGRGRKPGIAAAQLLRDAGMAQGQPAHVRLVDQGPLIRRPQLFVPSPVEIRVDHDISRHESSTVVGVQRTSIRPGLIVGVHRGIPRDLPVDCLAVGIEQELARVAAVPTARVVGSVHPEPVALAWSDIGQVTMPYKAVDLGQADSLLCPILVE